MLQEFFDIESFFDKWGKGYTDEGISLAVEQKYNGWRTVMQKAGNDSLIYFEDSKKDRSTIFPDLVDDLKVIKSDVIFDAELGAVGNNGRPIPRKDLADFGTGNKTINREFETTSGIPGSLIAHVFDVIYYNGEDLRQKPWEERRKILEDIFAGYDFKVLKLGDVKVSKSKPDIIKEINRVSRIPGSEGAVIKSTKSQYHFEHEPGWAKIKNMLELKLQVLEKIPVKGSNNTFNYLVGYALDGSQGREGGNIVEMGKTFNTKIDAKPGDILTIAAEEVLPVQVKGKWGVSFVAPNVRDIDTSRKAPESAKEIMQRADEAGVLQADSKIRDTLRSIKLIKQESNISIKPGDKGVMVLQLHERGLSEDQVKFTNRFGMEPTKLSSSDLSILNSIKRANWSKPDSVDFKSIDRTKLSEGQRRILAKVEPVSVHTDFRIMVNGQDFWEGGEGFTPGNQFQSNKFLEANKDSNIKILGDFKRARKGEGNESEIRGPLIWMNMGKDKPVIFKPGEVGATTNAFARLSQLDRVNFTAGTQDKHFKEFWFDGDKIKGRWIFTYVPTGPGQRQWMISKPKDQEMKQEKLVKIIKDEKKQIIYGIVYEPNRVDTDGDFANAAEIEIAAHKFLEEYNSISYMHKKSVDGMAKVVESYIAPQDLFINGESIPKGAWVMAVHIIDPNLWKEVASGKINAFSIEGSGIVDRS